MNSYYDDIRSRIPEEPTWFDVNGAPRWGEPRDDVKPFMGQLRCQDCHRIFRVCLVDEVYKTYQGKAFRVMLGERCPNDPKEFHVLFGYGGMHHMGKADAQGYIKPPFKPYNDPLPTTWDYGDPPAHGCVGDTMSSIPEWEWESWVENYGPWEEKK